MIRNRFDRPLAENAALRLSDALAGAATVVERLVHFLRGAKRRSSSAGADIQRAPAAVAKLALSATSVDDPPLLHARTDAPKTLKINVVRVLEVETHGENQPVEWTLATTEPIRTAQDLERIVDAYRARWVIEEYFKALKTGCAFEKRQLESMHTLLNGLAVFAPIAWRLLLLRTLARDASQEPASSALTPTQLAVLSATSKSPLPKTRRYVMQCSRLPVSAVTLRTTASPVGPVLGRGFHKLLAREEAGSPRSAQEAIIMRRIHA